MIFKRKTLELLKPIIEEAVNNAMNKLDEDIPDFEDGALDIDEFKEDEQIEVVNKPSTEIDLNKVTWQ